MFKNQNKGKLIAIEGLDGSGATTQTKMIADYFKKNKINHLITQEPTSSAIGGLIKSQLTGDWNLTSPEALQLLFAADRANHLEKKIIPKLRKGTHVVTDRYFLSSVAYGSLDINDLDWLYKINDQFIVPDLTILIKISAKTSHKRIKIQNGMELFDNEAKLQKVWETYEKIAKKYPNIKVIDGEKTEDEVFWEIKKIIGNLI